MCNRDEYKNKYEYKIACFGNISLSELEVRLNEEGQEGWRLINIDPQKVPVSYEPNDNLQPITLFNGCFMRKIPKI